MSDQEQTIEEIDRVSPTHRDQNSQFSAPPQMDQPQHWPTQQQSRPITSFLKQHATKLVESDSGVVVVAVPNGWDQTHSAAAHDSIVWNDTDKDFSKIQSEDSLLDNDDDVRIAAAALAEYYKERSTANAEEEEEDQYDAEGRPLHEIYEHYCDVYSCNVNTQILKLLQTNNFCRNGIADLSNNILGDRGIVPLLYVVQNLHYCYSLKAPHNNIGNEGTKAMAALLKDHPGLVSIDLSKNDISREGAMALLELVSANTQIVRIDLSKTKTPEDILDRIQRTCDQNSAEQIRIAPGKFPML